VTDLKLLEVWLPELVDSLLLVLEIPKPAATYPPISVVWPLLVCKEDVEVIRVSLVKLGFVSVLLLDVEFVKENEPVSAAATLQDSQSAIKNMLPRCIGQRRS